MFIEVKEFQYPTGPVIRVVYRDGSPFIVLRDVLNVLGYSQKNTAKTVRWINSDDLISVELNGKTQNLITPQNLLKAMRTKIGPTERRRYFLKWYTENLLPSIEDANSSKRLEDESKEGKGREEVFYDVTEEAAQLAKAIDQVLLALIDIALVHVEKIQK